MAQIAQIFKYVYCALDSPRFCHLPMQHNRNRQWLPENFQEVTLPTPANQCLQIATSYVERHTFNETKTTL